MIVQELRHKDSLTQDLKKSPGNPLRGQSADCDKVVVFQKRPLDSASSCSHEGVTNQRRGRGLSQHNEQQSWSHVNVVGNCSPLVPDSPTPW